VDLDRRAKVTAKKGLYTANLQSDFCGHRNLIAGKGCDIGLVTILPRGARHPQMPFARAPDAT
jgi:hypothetical protein